MNPPSARRGALRALPLTRAEVALGKLVDIEHSEDRPRTRADCKDGPRPCPWVGCRYHLYLDVNPKTGTLKLNFPDVPPEELEQLADTCVLDVAERGGLTLETVGARINLTRERARQLETRGLDRVSRALDLDDERAPGGSACR